MIISCPHCCVKYQLDVPKINENGQKVRCTKCSYIWEYKKQQKQEEPGLKVDISRNLPVVIEYVVPGWFKLMPAVFVVMIILTLSFFFQDSFSDRSKTWRQFYSTIGLPYNKGLVIDKLDVSRDGDTSMEFSVSLLNKSQENRKLPGLVVRAINDNEENTEKFYIKPKVKNISGNSKYIFSETLKNLPANTKLLIVEIADKFDLFS